MNVGDFLRQRASRKDYQDPYEGLPVDELEEPVLPRWFVIVLLASIPVAIVVFVVAFFASGPGETPVGARRPPPGEGLTSAVGDLVFGDREPTGYDPACEAVGGYAVAGTDLDRSRLSLGLDALCEAPESVRESVAVFGARDPVLRFAAFERTGVDLTGSDGTVYINARYSQTDSVEVAPLVAYQAVLEAGDPASAETVLAAREAELEVCDALDLDRSRACADAEALLGLDDPLAALREAGFR